MRAGGFSVQQALTPEAATIIKQSVTLARRRGHTQVSPLHVASTMLSTSNGLFRTACLQSHSHPLQCKALELCFNVALNRLPASNPSSPMLIPPHSTSHHYHFPSISNALVAAFKRAQAQQRRGSIENPQNQQQQPAVLTVKIELESLIISILDDPSVSRVMREAGFSSTQVKSNVEKTVSLQITCSQSNINSPSVTSKAKDDSIPSNGLRLSLITDSELQNQSAIKGCHWLINESGDDHRQLRCCGECTAKFENEVRSLRSSNSSTSSLPAWLQQYKNESFNGLTSSNNKECVSIKDLHRKWNSICSSIHQMPLTSDQKTITFSSISPSNSFGQLQNPSFLQTHKNWPVIESKKPLRDAQFWFGSNQNVNNDPIEDDLNLTMSLTPMSSQPNSALNSPSSSDVVMETEYPVSPNKFKELTAENLNTLCDALERKVPWQKDIIPEIIGTVLQCRSGMITRKAKNRKEETWLLFQGLDSQAKEKIAKELARTVFGSDDQFISIALSTFSSTRADSTEDDTSRNYKRSRDDQGCSYIERLAEAVSINPHRVFFIEDVDQADYFSQIGFKRAIESGKITSNGGHEASLSDAIIILSCESFSSRSRACSPTTKQKTRSRACSPTAKQKTSAGIDNEDAKTAATCSSTEEATSPCLSLDLNLSINDDDDNGSVEENQSIDDIGLLESVDRKIIFKVQEL